MTDRRVILGVDVGILGGIAVVVIENGVARLVDAIDVPVVVSTRSAESIRIQYAISSRNIHRTWPRSKEHKLSQDRGGPQFIRSPALLERSRR
jgi:hypothetical protein